MMNIGGISHVYDIQKSTLEYLKNNAMTQADLATKLGVSKQYLNQFLNGKRDSIKLELAIRKIID